MRKAARCDAVDYGSLPDRRTRLQSTEGSFAAEFRANLRRLIFGCEAARSRVVEAAVDRRAFRPGEVRDSRALRLDAARRLEERLLILRGPAIDLEGTFFRAVIMPSS